MTEIGPPATLDDWFTRLEAMPVPEGYKAEIIEGTVHLTSRGDSQWAITADLYDQLRTRYPRTRLKSGARLDLPGPLNSYAPDLMLIAESAERTAVGLWRCTDVEFAAEVLPLDRVDPAHGLKEAAYALAEVPVYLVVDPRQGRCHAYSKPKKDEYTVRLTVAFGGDLDLSGTPVDLLLKTHDFPRD
ncbi:Uma2 family endonuclease [Streptomyces bauhiniae]|uniref:Uma2 family endonuclease n=1 Tax=Streptomyces bauhiniae TaxID=2340725 RepID=A0A7K3R0K6_9ACTN|nr:Uma2 family endonuclease [Streptomyces bauhiniae]NEB95707.1 Uma2 family endonuclease [Streptomyces bauhiniae]